MAEIEEWTETDPEDEDEDCEGPDLGAVAGPEEGGGDGRTCELAFLGYTPCESAKDLRGDGTLWKETIVEGSGDEPPEGAFVTVHYIGTVIDTGHVFEDTYKIDMPVDFYTCHERSKSVMTALHFAVLNMRKGERAMIYSAGRHAFGYQWIDKVPKNACVRLEVELIDWMDKLLDEEFGRIIRSRIDMPAFDFEELLTFPCHLSIVEVEVEGSVGGRVFDNLRNIQFMIGYGSKFENVPLGIDIALLKFRKGEKSKITLSGLLGFGEKGKLEFGIPPDSEVQYIVKLNNFYSVFESTVVVEESVEHRRMFSEHLNRCGKHEESLTDYDPTKPIKFYQRTIDILRDENVCIRETDELLKKRKNLLYKAYLGVGRNTVRLGDHKIAINNLERALEIEANCCDTLLALGKAYLDISEPKKAMAFLLKAKSFHPLNLEIEKTIEVCQQQILEQRATEEFLYSKMLQLNVKADNKTG